MPDDKAIKEQQGRAPEPRGFGEHARGLAGEYAHEQGWGLNEEERRAVPHERQPEYGGNDYDYGARDFGDVPEDTSQAHVPNTDQHNPNTAAESIQQPQQQKGA